MTTISSYLTFSGNCPEAITFYKERLGGDLFSKPLMGGYCSRKCLANEKN